MEFIINKFLSLELESDITTIYVAEEPFQQCKFLLLEIPVRDITSLDQVKSIDEAAQELSRSLEPPDEFSRVIKSRPKPNFGVIVQIYKHGTKTITTQNCYTQIWRDNFRV